jgi:predicted SAM-dependent methyltransferase
MTLMKFFGNQSTRDLKKRPKHLQRPDFGRYFETLSNWIPISSKSGLEIGPMDKPLVSKPHHDIKYLDAFPFEVVLERCKQNPNRDPECAVQLDYVTENRPISESVDRTFDYVTAVHVVEHMPNLLGWLRDLANILNDKGKVFLVVPDRRFTFDHARPLTSLGQLIENDLQHLDKPSFRSVFDQQFYHRNLTASEAWQSLEGQQDLSLNPTFSSSEAFEFAKQSSEKYIDVHCSVFQPESFEELINASHELKLHPFRCGQIMPTSRPFLDFIVLLELRR